MRQCGDCQLCCTLLPLTSIGKAVGERCQHQKFKHGCSIFNEFGRPLSCTMWRCHWLIDESHAMRRPDHAGYFIDPTPDYVLVGERRLLAILVWVDPRRPDAHRDQTLRTFLEERAAESDIVGVVRIGAVKNILLVPPRLSETGAWHEMPTVDMKPATVGQVRRAVIEERMAKAASRPQ